MNKDIEVLKERIIAWVDERYKPYVIQLLDDLENAVHEHSFDNGYETGYDKCWKSGVEWSDERGSYK